MPLFYFFHVIFDFIILKCSIFLFFLPYIPVQLDWATKDIQYTSDKMTDIDGVTASTTLTNLH